ncbi:MAG: M20/M25/M40 family metallo-hydrolase [Bacteroidetes bacterium]|nr:M20/M25/M40 family metallo-hydrolase [Bacteroidota bacterium]
MKSKLFLLLTFIIFVGFVPRDGTNPEISKDDIIKHIKYLASDELEGRFPGTNGDKLAEKYILKEFESYGIKPAGEKGYLEPFEMVTELKLGEKNYFNTTMNGATTRYQEGHEYVPYGFSESKVASGELVFVGYGITATELGYDDYKDKDGNVIDVKGKIVVMMRYTPPSSDPHNNPFAKYEQTRFKILPAREGGAAGMILISGYDGDPDDKLAKLRFDNSLSGAGIPVINAKRSIIEGIMQANGINLKDVEKGINESGKPNSFVLKGANAEFLTDVIQEKITTNNIIGKIEGSDPVLKNEVVLIGAHKDHLGYGAQYGSLYEGNDRLIHSGADDNASGTSAVLELAQKFASNKELTKRTMVFMFFNGEEAGLLGSAYFTKSKLFTDMNVTAMINLDMVGRLSDNKLNIGGTGTSSLWSNLIDSVNKTYNFNLNKTPDGFGPSDHASFYSQNIPVLFFFTGNHPDYHKPSDKWDKINSDGEEQITKMTYTIALTMANYPSKIDFIKVVNSNEGKTMGGIKVYIGTIPDYSSQAEGMEITGVKAGSPAEKGGLQAKDVIIKFGKHDIKNVYDYTYALAEYKPNEEVEIVVKRNGETVTLKVVCGSR